MKDKESFNCKFKVEAMACAALSVLMNREPHYEAYDPIWTKEIEGAYRELRRLPKGLSRLIAISHLYGGHNDYESCSFISCTLD